ncbi:MAG TPA: flagellar basal body-associated FliL family protein [Actinotalea sp.]
MPTEQRIISSKPKINTGRPPGAGAITDHAPPDAAEKVKKPRKSKKKLLLVVLVVVLVLGGAGYWFVLKPKAGSGVAEAPPPPVPGQVVAVDAVSLNLAGGHYLRLGMGLQLTADVAKAPDTARALDLAINLFSGHTVEEVSTTEARTAFKAELTKELLEAYDGEVMAVYFTDYVTQ